MSDYVAAGSRVLALLGDPVAHSLSPLVHNAAIRGRDLDGVYVALRTKAEDLKGLVGGLARSGGGGNITLPHKERAATVVEVPSSAVRRTGACNTFWFQEGKVHGDNTDVEGFSRALSAFLGGSVEGRTVLLLGAGGAARACLMALVDEGAGGIHILNRNRERARTVSRRLGGEKVRVLDDADEARGEDYDLVVNTTSLGLDPADPLPFDLATLGRAGALFDLVYGLEPTPFLLEARRLGIKATDGGEMLLHQGAVAFERWWGVEAPLEMMRGVLREASDR